MNQFFTSDLHLGHTNIIMYMQRPFANVEEMHETIIDNWNRVVTNNDNVWIVGDLSLTGVDATFKVLDRLKGRLHLIRGNHDKIVRPQIEQFFYSDIVEYRELAFEDADGARNGQQEIVLFHYPIESWNKWYHGAWHLHGHIHSTDPIARLKSDKTRKKHRLDVGMDGHNFTPWEYEEIRALMKGDL